MSVRPEDVGMSSQRLSRIADVLRERYVVPGKLAGAVTLVMRRGCVVHLSAVGQRDRERALPMTEDTVFRIYSMTKPITSLAMMMLVEEGLCLLTDPVERFLPAWKDLRVYRYGSHPSFATEPPRRPMTLHDLLTHMSGLTYGFMHHDAVDAAYRRVGISSNLPGEDRCDSLEEMVERIARVPLLFSPGTRWSYSVATDVLGYLVERISGVPFDRFLRERILGPLGMHDTDFHVRTDAVDRFAANYRAERQADGSALALEDDPQRSTFLQRPTLLSGGGGLCGTASDYARFCQMLLQGGTYDGKRLVSRKTLELMTLNHLPGGMDLSELAIGSFSETTYDGVGFGLGFAVVTDVAKRKWHGSLGEHYWGGAASTAFWVDPQEQLSVVLMTQLMPSTTYPLRQLLRSLVYAALHD
jgi:CubicO group peptidase (beta-lactamase class C family)